MISRGGITARRLWDELYENIRPDSVGAPLLSPFQPCSLVSPHFSFHKIIDRAALTYCTIYKAQMVCPDALMHSGGYANDSFSEVHMALPKANNWEMPNLAVGCIVMTSLFVSNLEYEWLWYEWLRCAKRVFIVVTFFTMFCYLETRPEWWFVL